MLPAKLAVKAFMAITYVTKRKRSSFENLKSILILFLLIKIFASMWKNVDTSSNAEIALLRPFFGNLVVLAIFTIFNTFFLAMSRPGLKAILLEVVTAMSQRNGARNLIRFWEIWGKSYQILQQVCPETAIKLPLRKSFTENRIKKAKICIIERLTITFTSNGKREYVPRD